jgi:hypothetical protein
MHSSSLLLLHLAMHATTSLLACPMSDWYQQIKAFDELPDELPIWIIAESLRVLAPVRKEYQELFDIITKPSLDKD